MTKTRIKFRRYAFAVVFRKNDADRKHENGEKYSFLVFHRKKNWRGWEILKGGLMGDESEIQALKREIREETGAKKYKIVAKTRHTITYRWSKFYRKDHHIYHGA